MKNKVDKKFKKKVKKNFFLNSKKKILKTLPMHTHIYLLHIMWKQYTHKGFLIYIYNNIYNLVY